LVDPGVAFEALSEDGRSFHAGDVLGRVRGLARSLLGAERTALNFLQRMSGVATLTRAYVRAVAGTKAKILDTRKTTPGLRVLEKYAVAAGGGVNHRRSLSDMILIKDNHVRQVGGVLEALRRARAAAAAGLRIEVEITNGAEAEAALTGGADMIMLDNMTIGEMTAVVALASGRVPLEASGGMTLERVGEVAATGVDYISVGALTHSARAVDISLEFVF
jgi:nicotinate-nucleotide pyrophosphorylase (carboxylating)